MLACTYFFWSGWSKRDYLCTLDCRSRNATRNGNVSPCLPLIPFESLETYQGRFSDREECGLWLAALPLLIESSNRIQRNNLAFSVNYRIVYQVYWNKKINSNNRYVNVFKSIYSANILLWRTGSGKSTRFSFDLFLMKIWDCGWRRIRGKIFYFYGMGKAMEFCEKFLPYLSLWRKNTFVTDCTCIRSLTSFPRDLSRLKQFIASIDITHSITHEMFPNEELLSSR